MWFDTRKTARKTARAADASGLDYDALMAMKPHRTMTPIAPGRRFPGGERRGRVRAQGSEFEAISPYVNGDDIRHIDWRATARSTRVQVRRFAASAHRARCVAIDLRPDLFFGTQTQLMSKTSALTTAKLIWEAFLLNEPVGLSIGREPELLRPRGGKKQVERLLTRLWHRYRDVQAGEEGTPVLALLEKAGHEVQHGDELCLVSDFAQVDAAFVRASEALAERRVLTAVVVEDELTQAALLAGRYPVQTDQGRAVFQVGKQAANQSREAFEQLRKTKRRALEDCGWTVFDALDFLRGRGAVQ